MLTSILSLPGIMSILPVPRCSFCLFLFLSILTTRHGPMTSDYCTWLWTTGWLQGWLSLSFFWCWSNEYQQILRAYRLKLNCLKQKQMQKPGIEISKNTCFFIMIHSMQGWTATARHGVTREKKHKKVKAYMKSV